MTTSAILFDVDGTLVSTKDLYLEAYRLAVEPFIREELTREDIMAMRPTSEISFIRAVVAEGDLDACVQGFYDAYTRLHAEMFAGIYDGIPELLGALRETGLRLGVVTGKSRRSWEITSAIAELGPFDVLVFDDHVRAPKPDPHGLEIAIEELGVDAASAVYVGDTASDMAAARAAGLRPVSAMWARLPEGRPDYADHVREAGALTLLDHPSQLLDWLGITTKQTA